MPAPPPKLLVSLWHVVAFNPTANDERIVEFILEAPGGMPDVQKVADRRVTAAVRKGKLAGGHVAIAATPCADDCPQRQRVVALARDALNTAAAESRAARERGRIHVTPPPSEGTEGGDDAAG